MTTRDLYTDGENVYIVWQRTALHYPEKRLCQML